MRNIKYIVVHCTATPSNTSIESIKHYWKKVKGWANTVGYHYIIKNDGTVVELTDETKITNGVKGYNSECIHLAYIGGIDKNGQPKDTRSTQQAQAMFDLITSLSDKYPTAETLGHRDFPNVKKACPSFDVKTWLKNYVPDFLSNADTLNKEDENNDFDTAISEGIC